MFAVFENTKFIFRKYSCNNGYIFDKNVAVIVIIHFRVYLKSVKIINNL